VTAITAAELAAYITASFPGVETAEHGAYTFFFYGAERMVPFATIAVADDDYDRRSDLNRPGVFRLNLGVRRKTFQARFGTGKGDTAGYDYTALDRIMPHPDYSAQNFICVLSPSRATFEELRPLLAEAHALARERQDRRTKT
jgi:hypothetical protein